MLRRITTVAAQAAAAPVVREVFTMRKEVLTDSSVLFEVGLTDKDGFLRIASAATESQAGTLCGTLNAALHIWESANTGNTVDV